MEIVIDIGGTKTVLAQYASGILGATERMPTATTDPVHFLATAIQHVANNETVSGIGIAIPGPFSRSHGMTLNPPNLSLQWHNLALVAALTDIFHCPITMENDANCAALAEARYGAGRGEKLVVYYTISTGVGTGIVYNGVLLIGQHDNEGGHQVMIPRALGAPSCTCGGYGCLEALIGGKSLELKYGTVADELYDPAIWKEVGDWLGMAMANTIALLDPSIIIIGGGLTAHWKDIEPSLNASVTALMHISNIPPMHLEQLGAEQTLLGAGICLDQYTALTTPTA